KSAQIREILISESAWEEMTCLFAPSLISRLFHCAAKCRIIQQEYDTKTSKMFQSSHKMFQFVNLAELFSPQNGQGNTH
ncbi:hypothetical protein B5M02_25400, partial [Klebsiella pneumoniae]